MSAHDFYDALADWIYNGDGRGLKGRGMLLLFSMGGGVILGAAVESLLLVALFFVSGVTVWLAGMHGIKRAFPILPDAPWCIHDDSAVSR